ncbi:MAG: hypothetical protein ACE5HS_03880 [bacterium]
MVKSIVQIGVFTWALGLTAVFAGTPQLQKPSNANPLQPSQLGFELKLKALNSVVDNRYLRNESSTLSNFSANLQAKVQPKSKGRAFLQSLILPGWGQYYAGSKSMMKMFIVTEVLTWASYIGFTTWKNWLADDYRTFAVTHAGVDLEGKSERYFVDVGNFRDIFEFNQAQLRDRDVASLYPETAEFFWRWDSAENQQKFETLRIRSDRAGNRAEFALAAVFLNHLLSAIHSTLAVHKFNKQLAQLKLGLRMDVKGLAQNNQLQLTLSKRF